jgi:hypothetical protein
MNLRDRLRDWGDDDHEKRHLNEDENAEHGVNPDEKEEEGNGTVDKPAP